jgi:hypothetical protein
MFAFKRVKRNNVRKKCAGWLMAILPAFLAAAALLAPSATSAKIIIKPPPPYTPPSTPANFRATAVTETSITFAWTASTPGTAPIKYYVINELSPSDGFSVTLGANLTSFNWTFVSMSTTYTFEIYAVDSNYHVSAPSAPITVSTPPTPIIPAAPVITAAAATPQTITLNWTEATPSSGLNGFFFLVSPGAGGPEELNSPNPATATGGTVGGLFAGTTYSIAVVAESATFDYATSQVVTVTTAVSSNNVPPTAPTGLTVTYDPGTGLPDLAWNGSTSPYESSSDIQYVIIEDGVPDFDDSPPPGQTFADYVFNRVGVGQMNVYVIAVDQFGNASQPSNTISVTTFN